MIQVNKIIVSIFSGTQQLELGELVSDQKKIYFKYYADFIKTGLEISPIKLKLSDQIFAAELQPFDGLHGVFADSLPDGWGRLLLDRTLATKGVLTENVSMLQRLALVGANGMGALTYKPVIPFALQRDARVELDAIAKEMNLLLEGASSDALEELYDLGGSSGGARPKILVGYHAMEDKIIHGSGTLPKGYEHWLIKFQSASDRSDTANIEYAYYKMAVKAGIEMSESKLFKGKKGRVYFGTKRFDRIGEQRMHLHSAAGLMHDNFRYSDMDYAKLMDCAFRLENDARCYEKLLRLAAFNVFAHNRDDHSKNFSFLMDRTGKWKLAPAYDLTFSNSSHGYHSTAVMGESLAPGRVHLLKLANYYQIKKAKQIIEEVREVVSEWKKFAKTADVSKVSAELIYKSIKRGLG